MIRRALFWMAWRESIFDLQVEGYQMAAAYVMIGFMMEL